MKNITIESINDLVFMQPLNLFQKPDVILYHPGHFPELNEQLLAYYKQSQASLIMIPEAFNHFLDCSEYEYYAPLLIEAGIDQDMIKPIPKNKETPGVDGVIQSAFEILNETNQSNILLAGKSFFCRRFYLLASLYANDDKLIDILPLQDGRGIVPTLWTQSAKGRARILNEIEQYARISKEKIWNMDSLDKMT